MVSNFLKVDFPCLLARWLSKPYGLLVRAKQHPVVLLACTKVHPAPPKAWTKSTFLEERFRRRWSGIKRLNRKSETFNWNLFARVTVSGGWFGWVFVWQLAIDNVWPGHGTSGTPGSAPPHAPEHCASVPRHQINGDY